MTRSRRQTKLPKKPAWSTLAAIAYIKGETSAGTLDHTKSPRAPVSEAYRVLRTNLSFSAIDGQMNRLLVTSSSPSEGKSTILQPAVTLAQTGKQVVLIDADLRRPSLHKVFEVSNNQAPHNGITRCTNTRNRAFCRSPPRARAAHDGEGHRHQIRLSFQLAAHVTSIGRSDEATDFIILDTPPLLTVADASILASTWMDASSSSR